MTKKHFELFAATIKYTFALDRRPWAEVPLNTQCAARDAVYIVTQVAKASNDRFDETRFCLACGVPV